MHQNKHFGFTLIELLVALALVTIATSIVVLSFQGDKVTKELEASAREFSAMVREAQNYALTGRQAVPDKTPCYFQVSWSGSGYQIVEFYKNNPTDTCSINSSPSASIFQNTLKASATFQAIGSFYFTLPHAVPSFGLGVYPISIERDGLYRTICVYREGRVTDQAGSSCP